MQFLGQEQPELPEVALPRDGDHAINQGDSVVRLDNLLDGESEIELEQVVKRVTVREENAFLCRYASGFATTS